jgi:hypothetical protein
MSYVVATLDVIMEERQQFGKKCAGFFETIQKTRATVRSNKRLVERALTEMCPTDSCSVLQPTLAAQTQELKSELLEREPQAQALNDEIAARGKTLYAFTVVNVLSLPLGFFSSVSVIFLSTLFTL